MFKPSPGPRRHRPTAMRRLLTVSAAFFALALCAAQTAAAGGSWGPWEATYQGSISVPAGVVCPFAVSAEPVMRHMEVRYHMTDGGTIDAYQVKGPLVARVTNTETGASLVRNLASFGTVTLNPDGSYDALVTANFLSFFLGGESPANELLLLTGRTVLHGSPTGVKTLVSTNGRSEDLCKMLA
jgi:hypothetical protein